MLEPGLLYFAYGCNMHPDNLGRVVARQIQPGWAACLDGWRLGFNVADSADGSGLVASLVESEGCRTWGVVYRIPIEALRPLDEYEEVPHVYRRATVWIQPSGRPARQAALTYLGQPGRIVREGQPQREYASLLLAGARLHGLPSDYIDWLQAAAAGEAVRCFPG